MGHIRTAESLDEALVVGQMYHVRFIFYGETRREHREMVARYMGTTVYGETQWDLRPKAGTAKLSLTEYVMAWATTDDVKLPWTR